VIHGIIAYLSFNDGNIYIYPYSDRYCETSFVS